MPDESSVQPSLQDQIIAEMLASLQDDPNFDADLLEKLAKLGKKGDLKKAPQVERVIETLPKVAK